MKDRLLYRKLSIEERVEEDNKIQIRTLHQSSQILKLGVEEDSIEAEEKYREVEWEVEWAEEDLILTVFLKMKCMIENDQIMIWGMQKETRDEVKDVAEAVEGKDSVEVAEVVSISNSQTKKENKGLLLMLMIYENKKFKEKQQETEEPF